MRKIDIRTLPPMVQHKRRRRVIRLHEEGKSNIDISRIVGYCYSQVSKILQSYKEGLLDVDSPEPKVRGRRHGDHRILTIDQERTLKEILIDTSPAKLKYHTGLWTRKTISMVIEQEFGVAVPLRTITDYLERWGITPKRPIEGATIHKMRAIERWLKTEYPAIKDKSKKEKAEIHWVNYADVENKVGDDSFFSESMISQEEDVDNKHCIKILSTVTNRGEKRFMLCRHSMTSQDFCLFLRRLLYKKDCNVFLILHKRRVHKRAAVTKFLNRKISPKIELFYLP